MNLGAFFYFKIKLLQPLICHAKYKKCIIARGLIPEFI